MARKKKIEKNHVHSWTVFAENDDPYMCECDGDCYCSPTYSAVAKCRCGKTLQQFEIEESLNELERQSQKAKEE